MTNDNWTNHAARMRDVLESAGAKPSDYMVRVMNRRYRGMKPMIAMIPAESIEARIGGIIDAADAAGATGGAKAQIHRQTMRTMAVLGDADGILALMTIGILHRHMSSTATRQPAWQGVEVRGVYADAVAHVSGRIPDWQAPPPSGCPILPDRIVAVPAEPSTAAGTDGIIDAVTGMLIGEMRRSRLLVVARYEDDIGL